MIVLEQVSLTLGEFSLQDVNLRISKGEYLVIMGPSGAGKMMWGVGGVGKCGRSAMLRYYRAIAWH